MSTAADAEQRREPAPSRPARTGCPRGEWVDVAQAHVQGVPRRRRDGPLAADRLQLAARLLPGGHLPRRPARADRRLRRPAGVSRAGRARGRARARSRRSSADSQDNGAIARPPFVLGAAGAIWAASGAMTSIIKAVNKAYERTETRPFWKVRLTAIVLVLLTGLVTAALFLLIVFGGPLGEAIADQARLGTALRRCSGRSSAGRSRSSRSCSSSRSSTTSRPTSDHRNWKWVSPGSLVGARALARALGPVRALHEPLRARTTRRTGRSRAAIVLLLWLNYSAFALLFGAELNSELDRQADIHAAGGPRAGLIRHARRNR